MRLSPVFAALMAAGAFACSTSPTQPPAVDDRITGTWMWQRGNENNPAGAATVVLHLSASGGAITGSGYNAFIGVYPLTVSGAASGPAVDMTLIYERGDTVQFHGRLLAGGVLMGDESLDGRGRYPVEYHKVN